MANFVCISNKDTFMSKVFSAVLAARNYKPEDQLLLKKAC